MINDEILNLFLGGNVSDFEETTPNGNKIKGKILLNHGSYHGSILIQWVNGEKVDQFVRGFPKIKYYEESTPIHNEIYGFEKLDGTCVSFYQLRDINGNGIEIVPKSRQRAVIDEHFQDMLKLCNTYQLENRWNDFSADVIHTEMFGMLNEHTIPHKQTYIDLRLIGASEGMNMLSTESLFNISERIRVPLPNTLFKINSIEHIKYINYYASPLTTSKLTSVGTYQEVIENIKTELDNRNKLYNELKGYIYYEGVVLQNCYDGYNHYIKVKPNSFFELEGKMQLSVPINEIRKEIRKIINENLTTYMENYNEKEVIINIKEALLEEYSETDVNHHKTQRVLKKELHKYIDSIQDKSINKIVDDLMKNCEGMATRDMMRYFGKNYPMMKHRSQDVYFILSKRLSKGK